MRVFAITMVGGCMAGRDGLGAAERVLRRFSAADEAVAAAFVGAMKLVPSPDARPLLTTMLGAPTAAERAVAAEVLAYRGWLDGDALARLAAEHEPAVLRHALGPLAVTRHPDFRRVLERCLAHDDRGLQLAALDAMVLGAHADAATTARAAAAGALGDAALVRLALVADEEDARWLLKRMASDRAPAAIAAVGWAGHLEAVVRLIELLEDESCEEEAKLCAGAALERLLGAGLTATVEVRPEKLEEPSVIDPDPEPAPPRRSLAELVSDPRDLPSEGSSEALEVAATEPAPWRAWWHEHRRRFDLALRHRRGHPYAPAVSLHELRDLALAADERRTLQRELCARTGRFTHFDPHDFVCVQEQSLAAWASLAAQGGQTPGSWTRAVRV